MNVFDQLGEIYYEIDTLYANKEASALSKGNLNDEMEFSGNRQFNNQAYFLFMFTRLEDRVKSLSESLIDNHSTSLTDWKIKGAWDILSKRKENIAFMDRVALLTKINDSDYNLIQSYYNLRNAIGHGKPYNTPIDMPKVIADMKRLYSDLQP